MGTMQLAVKRMFLWEASKLRRLPLLPAVLTAVCLTLALALSATPARAEVKTGTIGKGCSYTLDDSGKLTIYPTDGVSGEMADPYSAVNYRDVRSVVIERGVSAPEDSYDLFRGLGLMESIDLSGLDTSRVTDMGWMFYGCSSLVSVDLSGWDTSQVTNMSRMFRRCSSLKALDLSGWDTSSVVRMDEMFSRCSSLASLDLSGWDTSSVVRMDEMFFDCSSLASLDLSHLDMSRVTDMHAMFSRCSSLASLDLSHLDTSNVMDMSDMFWSCSSLASLDLSHLDTSRVTDMGWMFYGCSSLSSIAVGKGAGRMLSSDSSGFPAGRDGKGWFSARDRRWLTVDEISSGRQGIADTYTTYETGGGRTPKQGGSRYRLGSVVMGLNGNAFDVLTCEKTVDVQASNTTFTLRATPLRYNADVAGYRLYQRVGTKKGGGGVGGGGGSSWGPAPGDDLSGVLGGETYEIATADASGDFGTLSYSKFMDPAGRNSKLYVRMVDAAGKTLHEEQVFISVKNSLAKKASSISLVPGELEFDFGDKFPFLRGMKFPVAKGPLTFKLTGDGKYQIGVNFDINDKKNDKLLRALSSGKPDQSQLGKRTQSGEGGSKGDTLTPKFKFVGYAEMDANARTAEGVVTLSAGFEHKGAQTQYHFAVVGFSTSGEIGGGVKLKLRILNDGRTRIIDDGLNWQLKPKLKGELYAGAGLANVASVGVWGSLGLEGTMTMLPLARQGLDELFAEGKAGVKGEAFSKDIFRVTVLDGKTYLYKRDMDSSGKPRLTLLSESFDAAVTQALTDVDSNRAYPPVSRERVDAGAPWLGGTPSGEGGHAGARLLASKVYPQTDVQLCEVEGGALAVYVADDPSRASGDRSRLVWTRYDEASDSWSEPRPVWDDGTADFTPSLAPDGRGGAHVAWSNARGAIADGATLADVARRLDVAYAAFDARTGAFGPGEFVTDSDASLEASPEVTDAGGGPAIAWRTNRADDVLGMGGGHEVLLAARSGGAWSRQVVARCDGCVTGLAAGALDGRPTVAWATDEDGATATTGDSRVYASAGGGEPVCVADANAANPQFATAGGAGALAWWHDGDLCFATSLGGEAATAEGVLPTSLYRLTGDLAGDALASFAVAGDGTCDVWGVRRTSDGWGDRVRLTGLGESVSFWDAAMVGGDPLLALSTVRYADATGPTPPETGEARLWSTRGSRARFATLDDVSFDESEARPGEALPLTVGVTNGGGATLDSCTVEVRDEGGKVVATEEVGLGLAPGASGEAKVSVTLPDKLDRALTYRVSVAPAEPGSEGREISVGAAHLSVRAVASMDGGAETVTATVTNRGLVASAAGRAIFYNPELGGELGTFDLPAIAPGGSAVLSCAAPSGKTFLDDGSVGVGVRLEVGDGSADYGDSRGLAGTWGDGIDRSLLDKPDPDKPKPDPDKPKPDPDKPKPDPDKPKPDPDKPKPDPDKPKPDPDKPKPEERDVSKASVDAIPDQAWTGSAVEPRPTVRLGGRTLSEGTDYVLSFRDNTDPGTATVTIEGRGSYTGARDVTFRIVRRDEPKPDPGKPQPSPDGPKPEERDVSRASVDAIPDQTFTGSPLEPRPAVRLGGRTLSEGTDYALSFGGNEGIGTATVTVTGKGAYTGAKSVTFRIGFSDVPAGHWALAEGAGGESYLAAVVRMGLMTGYGDPATGRLTGRFGPEDGVTRAQVVTVLYRRANPGSTDTTTGAHAENATSLSDNESGQYYTAAVNWAVRTGVVTGYTAGPDAGRFVPDREISREELATMVHRFAALEGASDSVPDSAYGGAPDAGDVSGWASGHVAWCYAHQVLTGHADTGLLEPQGTATRAQMAKMAVQTIKAMGR
ncbi:BspA family leucine-rich repeat surface protein [Olsenella sp. oral taxon 807]|uniref:BspA family leucine-rich repeat surface protein n=1 Tax=Olsenella sp. oral taxon 807 TaxID=712411 RepID=UPI00067E5770|nr:BspA family leucine-rich repeat surface protein [Olsenella sp. oral taxon 807]